MIGFHRGGAAVILAACALVVLVSVSGLSAEAPEGQGRAVEERAGEAVRLALADAVVMALRNNLDIRLASYSPLMIGEDVEGALSEFDPTLGLGVSYSSTEVPSFSVIVPTSRTRTWDYSASLGVRLLSGATVSLVADSSRTDTNNVFISSVNPSYATALSFGISQPLLRGAGTDVNRSAIVIQQNNLRASTYDFEDQVMSLVQAVTNRYWGLAFAREDLLAKRKSLTAAQDLLKNLEIRLEAGAGVSLDVKRATAGVAQREEGVVTAEAAIKDAEDELRRLVGPGSLPLLSSEEIIPIDEPSVWAEQLEVGPSVDHALSARPDVRRSVVILESYDIAVASSKNSLLPRVDLAATYRLNGLGASWGGDSEMLSTLDKDDVALGVTFSVPLGNRLARSEYSKARFRKLQAIVGLALQERDVTLSVKKAIRDVSTSLKRIQTNTLYVEAAREQLKVEVTKYDAGESIILDVLDAQEALQEAESAYMASILGFNQAMTNYRRETATILPSHNIVILPPAQIQMREANLFP